MAGYLQSNKNNQYQIGDVFNGAAGAVAKGQNQGGWNIKPMAGAPAAPPVAPAIKPTTGTYGYGQGQIRPDQQQGPQAQWVNQNGIMYGPNGQQMTPENYARMNGGSSSSFSSSYSAGGGAGYQQAFDAAKAANEGRYNQLLTEGQATRDRTMGYLDSAGQTERADLEKGYSAKEGSLRSRMGDYGLGGTSIGDSLSSGLEQAKNRDTSALNERLQGQRLSLDNTLSQQRAGVIERREDPYPSPEMAAASMSSSSSGYGGATGGPQGSFGQQGNAGMDWRAGPGGVGGSFVPRGVPAGYANSNFGQPTGVNMDYITPYAQNDSAYMDAFKQTPMTRPPKLLNNHGARISF